MENWGLISYREDALLFNPERHNLRAQKKIGSNFDISTAIYGTHLYKNILPHKIVIEKVV